MWRNFVAEDGSLRVTDAAPDEALRRLLHKTIKRVTEDMDRMQFNTAIAALIELNNELVGRDSLPRQVAETMLLLLSPIAPHICEELWEKLRYDAGISARPWPTYDPALLVADTVEYAVQVNGKIKGKVTVAADADEKAIEAAALSEEKTKAAIGSATVRKVIVVKGKLVNVVAK